MADSDDTPQPTFMHGLMAGLQSAPANPLVNMGLGLMSAAKPFGNVGDALMQANQQTIQNRGAMQQQAIQNYSLQRMKQMMPIYQKALESASSSLGGNSLGGMPAGNMTTGAQPPVPSAPPNKYQPLDPLPMIGAGAIGQINAGTALQGVPGMEKFGEALSGAPAKQQAALEGMVKQRQQQIAEPLSNLDSIMTSADADTRLQKDPDLKALWDSEQGGQPLTPPNARAYAGTIYNRLAGSAQSPVKPIPTMLQNVPGGQVEPTTGKFSGVPTSKYVQNGQVVELPTSQGIAQKLTPYDPSLLAAQQITPQALEQTYQVAKSKGDLTEAIAGRDPLAAAKVTNYIAQRAQQDGSVDLAAKAQSYQASQKVVNDFTDPGGTAGGKLGAINTAVLHTNALLPLIDAMGSGNMTRITAARQAYQKETGVAAPTNYETLANMAVGEIGSAINKTGGDVGERDRILAPFAASRAPDVLKGAVKTAVTALAGKTESLANQWDVGTQGTQGNFGKFLLPQTAQAQGWTLHKDAKGNKAYVSPDGKYFKQL
jgi:hypothetical protein